MRPYWFALLAALVWGLVPLLEKAGLAKCSAATGLFIRCFAVVFGALILLFLNPGIFREAASLPVKHIVLILLGGLGASFVGQFFFYQALKNGEVSRVVPIVGAYPLVTFILGVLLFSEKLTASKSLGVALIVSGIFLLK